MLLDAEEDAACRKAHGRHNRRVALQSRPDALPATACAGRDPQCRKGYSEIQGSVANVSDGL